MKDVLSVLRSGDSTSVAVFVATVVVTFTIFWYLNRDPPLPTKPADKDAEPPRNFTLEQLKEFRGQEEGVPIYVAIEGEVFDVSASREFYGPEGVYALFAGHDCTRSFALNSLEEKDLNATDLSDLTYSQKESLQGWIEKYKYYKAYPVVGRVVTPPKGLKLTVAELAKHDGTQPAPEGYGAPPIYLGVKGTVFDVSFGGVPFYGPGGPYHFLAGRDGSRPLAKMSFAKEDAESRDLSDLEPKQLKTLQEWHDKFRDGRKYPVVGTLVD